MAEVEETKYESVEKTVDEYLCDTCSSSMGEWPDHTVVVDPKVSKRSTSQPLKNGEMVHFYTSDNGKATKYDTLHVCNSCADDIFYPNAVVRPNSGILADTFQSMAAMFREMVRVISSAP